MSLIKRIFRKRKKQKSADLSSLQVDMHSHFLPGVDDGAESTNDSLDLMRRLEQLGYRHYITTPHIMSDVYPNVKQDLLKRAEILRETLLRSDIKATLEVSAEYFLDQHFMELIRQNELMPFGDNYILFEMSFIDKSPLLQDAIFELQSAGYTPILAHPERYSYLHSTPEIYKELVDQGVHLQVNINSFTEHYSTSVMKMAERLVDRKLITFLGTDCHHTGHLSLMKTALTSPYLHKLLSDNCLLNSSLFPQNS
ncbi:MAG: tyrosine-protein phosphatase [Flavobacteriales bacterium]